MPSRRLFLATLLAASVMTGAADAQGKGQGGGNAGAGGNNGSAGGNGNAGGGGNPGGGNGNAGGGNGNAGGGGENAADNETNKEQEPSSVASELPGGSPARLRLRHANGFEEEIGAGRYEMRDNRGRRIVSRAARLSDYARLRRLMEP